MAWIAVNHHQPNKKKWRSGYVAIAKLGPAAHNDHQDAAAIKNMQQTVTAGHSSMDNNPPWQFSSNAMVYHLAVTTWNQFRPITKHDDQTEFMPIMAKWQYSVAYTDQQDYINTSYTPSIQCQAMECVSLPNLNHVSKTTSYDNRNQVTNLKSKPRPQVSHNIITCVW